MRKGSKPLTDKGFLPIAYTAGVMVAEATAPGKTAADTGSGGGPYARALAEELIKPGVEAMTMFRRVALGVYREIGQGPSMSASTLPEVYFAGAPSAGGSAALTSEAEPAWAAARDTSDRSVLEAFISRFNDSFSAASPGSKSARAIRGTIDNPLVRIGCLGKRLE